MIRAIKHTRHSQRVSEIERARAAGKAFPRKRMPIKSRWAVEDADTA